MQRSVAVMGMFLLASLGCQAPATSIGPLESVATPVAVVASEQPVAAGSESVWGEVPKQCA
jgi:hypothetical protein